MRSRIPIGAAVAIALLALFVTWWAFSADPTRSPDIMSRGEVARPAGPGAALVKDRPLPTLPAAPQAAGGAAESQTPGVSSGGEQVGAAEEATEEAKRKRRGHGESPAARRARLGM